MKNKKANSIALIMLVILFSASYSLYSSHINADFNLDKTNLEEINTEIEIATQRAINFGIDDFLSNGFSNKNKVWYCNYPYPPDVDEVNASLEYFVEKRLDSYFEILRKEGYEIETPTLTTNFKEENLDENVLSIQLNDLIVGLNNSEIIFTQKFDKEYNYNWEIFKLYEEMNSWILNNHGGITSKIYDELFYDVPCQAVSSSCQCQEGGMLTEEIKEDLQLEIKDVLPIINESIEELNEKFEGTDISCSYEIEKFHIENIPKIEYKYSLVSYLQESSDILEWDEDAYEYKYTHYLDDYSLPSPGSDSLGGCPTDNLSQDGTYRKTITELDTYLKETTNPEPENESCVNSDVLIQKNELYALDKAIGLLLEIKCKNDKITIETKDGVEPLSANIRTRIAVKLECPIPTEVNLAKDPAYTCGGGDGGAIIVTGTIGCDFANECSECEQCIIDENEPDGYTCLPEPEGVPCSGVCTACDGNGECNMPIIGGVPDDCGETCMVCDGINTGQEACAPATGNLYMETFNLACDGTCLLCDENAECNRIPEDFSTIDSSFCGACQTCGEDGVSASCVANPEDNGEFISGNECQVCMDGESVLAVPGSVDKNNCGKCEVCSESGTCEFVEEFSTQGYVRNRCGKCNTCEEINGQATCVPDSLRNGVTCGGNKGCSVCTDGVCGGSIETLGQLCSSNYECETKCDANGKCTDSSETEGDVCSKIFGDTFGTCIAGGVCSSTGQCVGGLEPGTQCCGDLICPSGSPCCPNGGGVGIWTCEACNDETT